MKTNRNNFPNVVHVTAYYPPHLGGMELVVEKLANIQASEGLSVSVITSRIGSIKSNIQSIFTIHRLLALEIAHTPIMPTLFFALLKVPAKSLLHVHVAQAGLPELSLLAAKIKRCKIVMHIHSDVEATGNNGIILSIYKRFFLSFALRHSDSLIVPSESLKTQISNRYHITSKVFVVPAGVDIEFFSKKPSRTNSQAPIQLVYVGRLSFEKNIPMLIDAVNMLNIPCILTIAGDGPMKIELEAKISKLDNSIHKFKLVGQRTSNQVIEHYRQSDIALIASNSESQSLVALEAMASSTPVIYSPLPAVYSIVGKAGIQVEKSPEAFCHAITELSFNRSELINMGKDGHLLAKQHTWQDTITKLNIVYLEL